MAFHRAAGACVSGVIFSFIVIQTALAQPATFQVDPALSSLTVSGTVAGVPIQQQGPGSLTTTYQGPLLVTFSSSTIYFPGGSSVAADNSGDWQPLPGGDAGSAPANYGAQVVILFQTSRAAVREAIFDGTTLSPLALAGAGNNLQFGSAIDFTATSGVMDYNSPLAGAGTSSLAGSMATNAPPASASLTISAGSGGFADARIDLPIDFTITNTGTLGTSTFRFQGSMSARASARGGDSNFDGVVNLTDFNVLAGNFGTPSDAGWLQSDFNFDGAVNLTDFNILAGNFGMAARPQGPSAADWQALAAAIVPEPATSLLTFGVAASAAMSRRRRRVVRSGVLVG